jgi:hypothetical protein
VTGVTAAACAELATLTPMLRPALRRDTIGGGRYGRLETSLSLVNTDVLSVMITLRAEIPAATMTASRYVGEPWQARTLQACLIALPRLAARMTVLNLADRVKQLDLLTASWVRQTKRALGLRTPDLALGDATGTPTTCPECLLGDPPYGHLYMAGSEGFIRPGPTVEWVTSGRVYCRRCGADWQQPEWGLLEQMIRPQHAQGPTSLPQTAPDVAC